MTLGAQLPEIRRRFFRRAEGDQVAEPLVDREQPDAVAVGFGVVGTMQLVVAKAAHQKMAVIDEGVFDAGRREIGCQLRLPHPLREPQAGRLDAETALQVCVHSPDLLQPVGAGQRRENRLVESREQQLQPAIGGEPADHVEPGRVVVLEPLEQRPRHVQRQREEAGGVGALDDGPIDVAHVIGHDVIEIPHRLMQVQAKDKAQWSGHVGVGCSV